MNIFEFTSSFNTAYNNKFRFLIVKKSVNIELLLKMLVRRGLILGFFIDHENIIVNLKYIKDTPFFKIISISKPSRRFFFSKKKKKNGRISGNDFYIISSPTKRYYFSDDFKEDVFSNEGGEIHFKISFFNENNFSKKNNFI